MLYYVCIHDGFVLYIYNIVTVCALDHSCLTPWIPRMDQAARCGLSCAYTWPRSRRCHLIGGEVSRLTIAIADTWDMSQIWPTGPQTLHFGGSQFRLSTEIFCKVGDFKLSQALESMYVLFEPVAEQVFVKHGQICQMLWFNPDPETTAEGSA